MEKEYSFEDAIQGKFDRSKIDLDLFEDIKAARNDSKNGRVYSQENAKAVVLKNLKAKKK